MKYCSEQGCRTRVEKGRYCEAHKRKPRYKGNDNKSFYNSSPWKAVKAFCYQRDKGRCTECGKFVFGHGAQHHHIIPIRERPDLKLEPENITTLCPKCHMLIENASQKNKMKW